MKKLIISGVLAFFVLTIAGCTCSRDTSADQKPPLVGACEQGDQGDQNSCLENSKKIKMEKRRAIKFDARRFSLNRDLLNGAFRKKMEEDAKQPPASTPAPAPAVKPAPTPAPVPVPTKK